MSDLIIRPAEPEDNAPCWTEVAYTVAAMMSQNGFILVGKACGIRSDGNGFYSVYALPLIYPAHFDWTEKALERLDTFLDCGCSLTTGACSFHRIKHETWGQEDSLRNTIIASELPEALKGHVQPAGGARIVRPS